MNTFSLSIILTSLVVTISCADTHLVGINVTEENGAKLHEARCEVIFLGYGVDQTNRVSGLTNEDGFFEARGTSQLRAYVSVEKDGFYATRSGSLSRKTDHNLNLVLRKIVNPIPLCAKRLDLLPPISGKEVGYDLKVGDWTAPYGKGKTKDLLLLSTIIRNNSRYSDFHHEIELKFSNPKDGFLITPKDNGSEFKSPHNAPIDGNFLPSYKYSIERKPNEAVVSSADPNRCFIFRLRTVTDELGNIISCHYAKAYGDFPNMALYFNPSVNDSNIEFSPGSNLIRNLDSEQQVVDP